MKARIENLRAALSSIEARLDRVLECAVVPHEVRVELGQIRAAAKGAVEIDVQAEEAAKPER